jgi:hypothetical protein
MIERENYLNINNLCLEPTRKRSISNLDQVDIDSKKFKADESDIKNEDGINNSEAEKLKGVVRNMTRKVRTKLCDVPKFISILYDIGA